MAKIIFDSINVEQSLDKLFSDERVIGSCIYSDIDNDDYTFFGESGDDKFDLTSDMIIINQTIRVNNQFTSKDLEHYFKSNIANDFIFEVKNRMAGNQINWYNINLKIKIN